MKFKLLLISLVVLFASVAQGQVSSSTARRVRAGTTLPTTCRATNPVDVFIDSNATITDRWYICTSTNTWTAQTGPATAPGGSNTHVQFNDSSAFGGDAGLTYNKTTDTLSISGLLQTGTGPTTLTDAAGKILSASLNTVAAAQGGFGSNVSAQSGVPLFATGTPTFTSTTGTSNFVRATAPSFTSDQWITSTDSAHQRFHFAGNGTTFIKSGQTSSADAAALFNFRDVTDNELMELRNRLNASNWTFNLNANVTQGWSSTGGATGAADTGIARHAAGVLEVNSGAPGTLRDITFRNFKGNGTGAAQFRTTQTTVPVCSTNCGTSPTVTGTDTFMKIVLGTTPASAFLVTFNGTWAAAPPCVVQMGLAGMVVGKLALTAATTTTTITVVTNGTAPSTGDIYFIHCGGLQ